MTMQRCEKHDLIFERDEICPQCIEEARASMQVQIDKKVSELRNPPPRPMTASEHAEIWEQAAEDQARVARIAETNGCNDEAMACRVLNCAFATVAKRYVAKAKAQEPEESDMEKPRELIGDKLVQPKDLQDLARQQMEKLQLETPEPPPTPADIWKVHAEVWRAEANRLIDETVNSIEGSTLDTLVVNALRIQAEHIAKRYQAKAVQETEG